MFFVCLCAYFWYVFFVCTPPLHTLHTTPTTHFLRHRGHTHTHTYTNKQYVHTKNNTHAKHTNNTHRDTERKVPEQKFISIQQFRWAINAETWRLIWMSNFKHIELLCSPMSRVFEATVKTKANVLIFEESVKILFVAHLNCMYCEFVCQALLSVSLCVLYVCFAWVLFLCVHIVCLCMCVCVCVGGEGGV